MTSRKKRKLDTEAPDGECFGEVVAELDLEISLRRRLAETIESRITWALVLQEELKKSSTGSTTSFKDAAFEAISAIETSLDVLFTHEIAPILGSKPVQPLRPPRPPPKQKATRNPNANFLYIKSADLHPPYDENHVQTYLLKCPTCLRKTFTSLQGLLNHARISHGLEWGTHDECVRACAVVDPEIDVEAGIEVGLGPSGILPGLRSLFQMAVAAQYPRDPTMDADASDEAGKVEPPSATSHLVRTLGLHEDTPALARFLGKQAVRRGIRVWGNGDEVVDVDGFGDAKVQRDEGLQAGPVGLRERKDSSRTWRMHFTHRSDFDPETASHAQELGPIANGESAHEHTKEPSTAATPSTPRTGEDKDMTPLAELSSSGTAGSRFHFTARVIVMDRSLWIPPEGRPAHNGGQTHKWMISVDSPSYSHHITSILTGLTVSSLSAPSSPSLTTTSAPFVVVGTMDEPFLAKVELHFSGTPSSDGKVTEQSMILEHWVELDLLKSATPVVGDEQVVDIELDKRTILLPIQKGYTPIGAKALWSQTTKSVPVDGGPTEVEPSQAYGEVLSSIVGRFPMLLKGRWDLEVKSGRQAQPQLPYKLVPAVQFNSLLPGRRKAIEWSRARAIRDAYTQLTQDPRSAAQKPAPLTTADVYSWLSEEGHFIRPADASGAKKEKDDGDKSVKGNYVETWCSTCGQGVEAHAMASAIKTELVHPPSTSVKMEAGFKSEDQLLSEVTQTFTIPCNIAPRIPKMPMLNACIRMHPSLTTASRGQVQRISPLKDVQIRDYQRADLVAASDPNLTLAIHKIIHSLKLPTFISPLQNGETMYPLDELGTDKTQVEDHLAPHAILAIAAQRFMCALVEGGIDVARREKAASSDFAGAVIEKRRRNEKEPGVASSVLTPTHVLRSVISRAEGSNSQRGVLGVAMFECLARLGVPATPNDPPTGEGTQGQAHEPVVSVKQEEF
ncbi:hypothetical protein FPV67DRAFT_1667279 [Lyophyllum atratum]|nr:hypothetical protein FPV67DRAFT_1667279 [Lyophyllum atratum]